MIGYSVYNSVAWQALHSLPASLLNEQQSGEGLASGVAWQTILVISKDMRAFLEKNK